jgi:hypothetical protein
MFVLAHVSSIKTRRSGFRSGYSRCSSSRLSATSGRSLSEATSTFFEGQPKPLQRGAQRRNRQVRPKFPLQFLEGQIRIALDDVFDLIRECRPERHTPPLQKRRGLVEFSTLLLDTPPPGLAHVKVRCNLRVLRPLSHAASTWPRNSFEYGFMEHLLGGVHVTCPAQIALDLSPNAL